MICTQPTQIFAPKGVLPPQRVTEVFRDVIRFAPSARLECTCGGKGSPETKAFAEKAAAAGSILFYRFEPGNYPYAEFYEREAAPFFQKLLLEKYGSVICPCVALRESAVIEHWILEAHACAHRVNAAEPLFNLSPGQESFLELVGGVAKVVCERPLAAAEGWITNFFREAEKTEQQKRSEKTRHLAMILITRPWNLRNLAQDGVRRPFAHLRKKLLSNGVSAAHVKFLVNRARAYPANAAYGPLRVGQELDQLAARGASDQLHRAFENSLGMKLPKTGFLEQRCPKYVKPYLRGDSQMLADEVVAHYRLQEALKEQGRAGEMAACAKKLAHAARAQRSADWAELVDLALE